MSHSNLNVAEMVCKPISSYSEFLQCSQKQCGRNVVQLQPRSKHTVLGAKQNCHDLKSSWKLPFRFERNSVPKTLFCHDLKGGYLEDKFPDGSAKYDEYRFFHWGCIDIFVYFSHHFVTIPPNTWINAAHVHGVKVLGTIITEWEDGAATWNKIFESEATMNTFANSLVSICLQYGFEGYLLNVENKLKVNQVKMMEKFVKTLHNKLHESVDNAELIWYDSVTKEGKLEWQNELNDLNRVFFDSCDGIFLNYTWSEKSLLTSVLNAGVRMLDVYVGVDVFGRNCYSGGGFNTHQALKLIKNHNLSLALFAPSWTHECLDKDHFVCLEYIFWKKLWQHLYIHGPSQLPFTSSFCQGYGKKLYQNGEVISNTPWYNLCKQQYQPSIPSCLNDNCIERKVKRCEDCSEQSALNEGEESKPQSEEKPSLSTCTTTTKPVDISGVPGDKKETSCGNVNKGCVQHYGEDAFMGGGCLEIRRLRLQNATTDAYFHRLLMCDFHCNGNVIFSVATKNNDEENTDMDVMLLIEETLGKYSMKVLFADVNCDNELVAEESKVYPVQMKDLERKISRPPWYIHFSGDEEGPCWVMRHYLLDIRGRILEIGLVLSGQGNSVLLGFLGITPVSQLENA